jgi:hypothetical protein
MSVESMSSERLMRYCESIRRQVEADQAQKHQFMANSTVREYADKLQGELIKRRLEHSPIEWPRQ